VWMDRWDSALENGRRVACVRIQIEGEGELSEGLPRGATLRRSL
jgi:hypothetical protein